MRQQEDRQYHKRTESYIDGNTVRKRQKEQVHEEYIRRQEEAHEEYVRKQKRERERRERQKSARAAARRNQEQALQMSLGYVVFLAGAMAALAVVFGCYLYLQSMVNGCVKNVTALEAQVLNLKNDNDVMQKKINSSVDLETIRKKAMEDLGMVYPSKEQIEYFDVETNDYMNQYEDIPER